MEKKETPATPPEKTEKAETSEKSPPESEIKEESPVAAKESQVKLFKSYMQCFTNLSDEKVKYTKKWEQLMKDRKFWDTQPVLKVTEMSKEIQSGPLKTKEQHKISENKTKLPPGFSWREFDLKNETDIQDLYVLLYENYVEDDGGVFRFNYSKEFLQWALMPPGYQEDLYFGITYQLKKKTVLIGFISGIVLNVMIEDKKVPLTEVNFLCVHKKYRSYSMASVLIREVVRRSNMKDIFQGLYTSGTMLPTPFAQTRYWHRSLNPEKLIKVRLESITNSGELLAFAPKTVDVDS
jgi:glycylpeptide N-tetradecanoyltransferase